MWSFSGATRKLGIILGATFIAFGSAQAQTVTNNNTQNFGFNLPSPPMPNGFDEVRASDGTTCRSAIANNGPYLDVGGIAAEDSNNGRMDGKIYGRVIIPLGEKPDRISCRSLYQLEIDRLKHELRVARSGSVSGGDGNWQNTGWNNK